MGGNRPAGQREKPEDQCGCYQYAAKQIYNIKLMQEPPDVKLFGYLIKSGKRAFQICP